MSSRKMPYVVRDFAIDSTKYTITYPSKERFEELALELAKEARAPLLPGQQRRKFICVHCGDASFTSKNRLNNHRYVVGCERALLPDGRQARILPYPQFQSGQGKAIELLAKDRDVDIGAVAKQGQVRQVGEDTEGDSEHEAAPRTTRSCITSGETGLVPVSPDIIVGPLPPRTDKSIPASQKRVRKRSTKGAQNEAGQSSRGREESSRLPLVPAKSDSDEGPSVSEGFRDVDSAIAPVFDGDSSHGVFRVNRRDSRTGQILQVDDVSPRRRRDSPTLEKKRRSGHYIRDGKKRVRRVLSDEPPVSKARF
jgi:hypothetical protein